MKLVDDNMRKLGLAIILAGLMIVILGVGKYFEESLRTATLTQNSMVEFKQYDILDGKIKYKLPSSWLTTIKENKDDKIVYLNEFVSDDANTYGSIELISSSEGVEATIDKCIEDVEGMGIKDYKKEKVKIDNIELDYIKYDLKSSKENVKRTYEYYVPYDDYVARITFIISDKKARENTQVVFENIVKTFSFEK
ncbi:hypothetical protein [Clostridium sp. UBA5988]|uniref:PsbP C-terminal domain-containing protein n=1 Tax=Clostridium sulfidigenes TaxID=318464 RepID=A0A927W8Q7_9CLOT|nr:hypothetical protein [Clostridium sulfidigenes]